MDFAEEGSSMQKQELDGNLGPKRNGLMCAKH